jgi:hypothetical protein
MKIKNMLTALLLLVPAGAWAGVPVEAPEPGVLPLLAVGGAVILAARLLRRKK